MRGSIVLGIIAFFAFPLTMFGDAVYHFVASHGVVLPNPDYTVQRPADGCIGDTEEAFNRCQYDALCEHGRPRHRLPDCPTGVVKPGACISYGGLRKCREFERDHICPLGLGCPDTLANLQYQPYPEADEKDEKERQAEHAYCAGRVSLIEARAQFHREYPVPRPGQCP